MNQINPSNEKVVINVSGMHFETWTWTLNRFPNTLLGNPTKRRKYFDRIHNQYFFERHRQSFEAILYYYQSNGKFLIRPYSVSSEVFFDEIVFFQLGKDVINKYKKDEGYMIDKEANLKLPKNKLKRAIWLLFEYPQSSIFARIIAITSVLFVIISISMFCIETLPDVKAKRSIGSNSDQGAITNQLTTTPPIPQTGSSTLIKDEFFIIETICIIWFSIELVMRFYAAPNKLKFVKEIGNLIDFFSILPYFMQVSDTSAKLAVLRIIRLVRVFRVFKLARHFKGLQILAHTFKASANELMLLMFFLLIGVVLFSSVVYFIELDDSKSDFDSIPDGFWYAIITMTTVGYGEMVPKTPLGRVVGCFCALAGVLTIALPVPIIVSHFQFFYQSNEVLKKLNADTLKASYRNSEDEQNDYFENQTESYQTVPNTQNESSSNTNNNKSKSASNRRSIFGCMGKVKNKEN